MPMLNNEELAEIRLSIIKDLEKTLKAGYQHQYKNILAKIVSNKKRFIRKRLPSDVLESKARYDALSVELTNYLINLFDVFGENAVLNAKRIFEENGLKWGKKLRKKLSVEHIDDINPIITSLYISVPESDYIDISSGGLLWHFNKLGGGSINDCFDKFYPKFYDIKATWLYTFIKCLSARYISFFEIKGEDNNSILTSIELKDSIN